MQPPHLAIFARSIFAIRASHNKIERSFSAAAHIMTDLRSMLDPSHLDELVILRSVYHAADSQLACDEDEGRHVDTVNRRQLDTGTSGSLRLLSYVRYI